MNTAFKVGLLISFAILVVISGIGLFSWATSNLKPSSHVELSTPRQSDSADINPPGKPWQDHSGWSVYMERPIKAKLRNPDSFKFYLGTPFELTAVQGVEYWLSAIEYGAQNGFGGMNREIGMVLEKNGQWLFYTQDECSRMKLNAAAKPRCRDSFTKRIGDSRPSVSSSFSDTPVIANNGIKCILSSPRPFT
jgi:hypothetical protein